MAGREEQGLARVMLVGAAGGVMPADTAGIGDTLVLRAQAEAALHARDSAVARQAKATYMPGGSRL